MNNTRACKWYVLDYLKHNADVTRKELMNNRGGFQYEAMRKALSELYSENKIWIISDGTIEAAGETATL